MPNLPTTQKIHATPCAARNTKGAVQIRFCNCSLKLVGTRGQDNKFIDVNEHILSGMLPNSLYSLGLLEATHLHWAGTKPRTYVHRNGTPIDWVFHTLDLEIKSVLQLSFHKGVHNHRTVIINILTSSAIGKFEHRAPQARRLTTKNTASVKEYIKYVST
jgi:hypothetical protein